MLFHPDRYPGGNYEVGPLENVAPRDVFFPSANGRKLHAWHFDNPSASRTVLLSHGNAGNLSYRAGLVKLLLRSGLSVFIYDYQGYGLSEGSPTLKGICHDGESAYDYLTQQHGVPAQNLLVYGESLGTGVTCHIASSRPTAGIILQSAFISLNRIGREVMPLVRIYPQWLFPRPVLDNLSTLRREHSPLLLLHGMLDMVVPFGHAREIYEYAMGPKTLVPLPSAGHADISAMEPERFVEAVRRFVADLP